MVNEDEEDGSEIPFKRKLYLWSMKLSSENKVALRRFFSGKPVKKAYVFGSYARNEANNDSDLDILVDLDYTRPIGMKFFSYQPELEKLLNMKVDLITSDGLSKYVKPFIDSDKVIIYERESN